jgi:integrative and conjugative element protein (TIGR02256 family)
VPDLDFRSDDARFGLRVTERCVDRILELCQLAGDNETGGIVIGYYASALDQAVAVLATDAPEDSQSSRSSFSRGIKGLRELLDLHWTEHGHYYIGEWHFHPAEEPSPSKTDRKNMKRIAGSEHYQCSTPLLLIVGELQHGVNIERVLGAYAFPEGESYVPMCPIQ